MSAFLGPIHHKMYGKMLAQSQFAHALAAYADQQGWTSGLEERLAREFPLPQGQLEAIIDLSNIHGWLNGNVAAAEGQLALAVGGALAGHPDRRDALLDAAAAYGQERAGQDAAPARDCVDLWQKMDAYWLDGMPCDRSLSFTASDPGQVTFSIRPDCHAEGWQDIAALSYGDLRWAWLEAFARRQGFAPARPGELTFTLQQREE